MQAQRGRNLQPGPKARPKEERKKIPQIAKEAYTLSATFVSLAPHFHWLRWHGSGLEFPTTYFPGDPLDILFLQLGNVMNM